MSGLRARKTRTPLVEEDTVVLSVWHLLLTLVESVLVRSLTLLFLELLLLELLGLLTGHKLLRVLVRVSQLTASFLV